MVFRLCLIVESFYSPIRNIFPRISLHALPCHMTTKKYADFPSMAIFLLPAINRVANVRNQTSQAFVTSRCKFCDCSCQFVYWRHQPMRAKYRHVRTICEQTLTMSPTVSNSSFSNWWSSSHDVEVYRLIQVPPIWIGDHPSKDLGLCITAPLFFVCQFAVPFNAVLCMSFHVVGPRNNICTIFRRSR